MDEFCPLCQKKGLNSRVISFQINLKEAVMLCEVKDCVWPFGHKDFTYVQRDFRLNNKILPKRKKSPKTKDSKGNEGTQKPTISTEWLYTPPVTPKEDVKIKDNGKGNDINFTLIDEFTDESNHIVNNHSNNYVKTPNDSYAPIAQTPQRISTLPIKTENQRDKLMTQTDEILYSIFDIDHCDKTSSILSTKFNQQNKNVSMSQIDLKKSVNNNLNNETVNDKINSKTVAIFREKSNKPVVVSSNVTELIKLDRTVKNDFKINKRPLNNDICKGNNLEPSPKNILMSKDDLKSENNVNTVGLLSTEISENNSTMRLTNENDKEKSSDDSIMDSNVVSLLPLQSTESHGIENNYETFNSSFDTPALIDDIDKIIDEMVVDPELNSTNDFDDDWLQSFLT